MLSEAAVVPFPQWEMTETIYKPSQIVCVKPDSSDSHNLFTIVCLQEHVSAGMKRAKAKVFIQDAFNQVLFTEDTERQTRTQSLLGGGREETQRILGRR